MGFPFPVHTRFPRVLVPEPQRFVRHTWPFEPRAPVFKQVNIIVYKIVFAGTPDFATPTLQMLIDSGHEIRAVYTQPDRAAGRGRQIRQSSVKQLALQYGIQLHQPASLKSPEQAAVLQNLDVDLMVVVAYGLILPKKILEIPRLGCVNVHASILPRWRGAAPIQRAVMAGDRRTGVTIMQMELGLDTGPVFHQAGCSIEPGETAGELHDRLSILGSEALKEVLSPILSAEQPWEVQDHQVATYAEKLSKSEAILDWGESAIDLQRRVMALNSWPVAQTVVAGKTLRIWRAEARETETSLEPGTVLDDPRQLDVATEDGVLRLLEVQLPGGKRITAESFLNANTIAGTKLG